MSYLVELVVKFPIDWQFNLKIFNFCHFSKKSDVTPTKIEEIGQKIQQDY